MGHCCIGHLDGGGLVCLSTVVVCRLSFTRQTVLLRGVVAWCCCVVLLRGVVAVIRAAERGSELGSELSSSESRHTYGNALSAGIGYPSPLVLVLDIEIKKLGLFHVVDEVRCG